jgi:thiamine transporter
MAETAGSILDLWFFFSPLPHHLEGGICMKSKSRLTLRALTEGAIFVALAQVLSMLKLWEMPWGGSVTLAMVPILLYAIRWGLGPGLLAGFVFGILQFAFDGGFAITWQSIIGDYLLAFAVIGFAGLAHGKKHCALIGTLIGGFARFLVHYVVGATVWAEYMPDSFFGMTMHSPWFYSLLYNLAYMVPNIIISLIVFALLWKPLGKYIRGEDLAR